MSAKIPATVVTGFLGAGKTSLIQNLLRTANGKRLALIINEFGDIGVDGEILKGCRIEGCEAENIIELANGCICCTVADDFLPTIEALLNRAAPPDHIVIETSGLALPKPLLKAFAWPEVRTRDSILLTYFVDSGLLRFLRNRAKRVGNLVRNEVKYITRF